jgi:hypothetical protein
LFSRNAARLEVQGGALRLLGDFLHFFLADRPRAIGCDETQLDLQLGGRLLKNTVTGPRTGDEIHEISNNQHTRHCDEDN